MIADKNLSLPIEYFSYAQAPFLVKEIWTRANEMGYTEFKDGTIIESAENRLVIFPSDMRHTGTTCTNAKNRIVVNINYF